MSDKRNIAEVSTAGINLWSIFPLPLAAVLTAGVLLRVVYWLTVADEAWFQAPGMDPEYYDGWAQAIMSGEAGKYIPFPRGPLYPYILAGLKAVCGSGWLFPRLFNLFADIATIASLFHFGRLVCGMRVGVIAATAAALSGTMVYFSGELLGTALETALAASFLLVIYIALEKNNKVLIGASGVILGLFCITRPNAMLLLALYPLLIIIQSKGIVKTAIQPIIIHITAAILCIAPVTLSNYVASGEFIPISTLGGVNFYIGNVRGASGWSSFLPGVGAGWDDDDAKRIAETDAGRTLSPGEISDQLFKIGLREIKADFKGWLALMLRKLYLLVGRQEIGNNRPLELVFTAAPFVQTLMFFSIGFLIPTAFWGALTIWRSQKTALAVNLAYIIIFGGGLVLFFISARYRMPLLPPLALLTAVGVEEIVKRIRLRKSLLDPILVLVIGWGITMLPWTVAEGHPAQAPYVAGNAYLHLNRCREAIEHFKAAYRIDPDFLRLKLNLGVAYMQAGDTAQAEVYFNEAVQLPQSKAEALNNLGVIAETHSNLPLAELEYSRAYQADPQLDDARLNLARVVMTLGDSLLLKGAIDSGEMRYRYAEKLLPGDPRPSFRLAVAAMGKGRKDEALRLAKAIIARHPDFSPAQQMVRSLSASR